MNQFLQDVIKGLSATEKYLQSKYFYDETGDKIFQQIMACPEYYLTKCEMEIFTTQTKELAAVVSAGLEEFDVVELGAGDATKSIHLLGQFVADNIRLTYYPVDISTNVINLLHNNIPKQIPSIKIEGLNGEYFAMLEKAKTLSNKIKVVLFLGSNIGNVPYAEAESFCKQLRSQLVEGDIVLIGFDLKKDPNLILKAYDDGGGLTKCFNLNLLTRINKEFSANFNTDSFQHYPNYDPQTGACKSFLVSKVEHEVTVAGQNFHFAIGESIFTEISQKYTVVQTDQLAIKTGFTPLHHFYDSKKWFVDAIWRVQ